MKRGFGISRCQGRREGIYREADREEEMTARRMSWYTRHKGRTDLNSARLLMAKKKSTVASIGKAISGAASTVADSANRNVVQPVGKALGMIDKKPKKAAKKKPVVKAVKATVKSVAKKMTPKKATKKR